MTSFRFSQVASAAVAALCLAGTVNPSPAAAKPLPQQSAPDNSQNNQNQSATADNQSNATTDRHLAAKVRRAIIADKELSTYAHNVKILTANGEVTLKGPVKSDDEKQKVFADASGVVSADKINNQLTVKQ